MRDYSSLWSKIETAVKLLAAGVLVGLILLTQVACTAEDGSGLEAGQLTALSLPELPAIELAGRPLRVVATTSIIGDLVAQVGGEAIDLTVLMAPGQDPHSFQPTAADMAAAAEADVIFVNGWNLEEGLLRNLTSAAKDVPMVPVSANIQPLASGGDQHDGDVEDQATTEENAADPHTWLDPHLAVQLVSNIEQSLQALDPDHAADYAARAADYREELRLLVADYDRLLGQLPAGRRKLVTNHEALGYLAAAYNFTVIGTVIPGVSTIAEPSAGTIVALAQLMNKEGVCTIFVETTANDQLARSVAAEVDDCPTIRVVTLYTGALGSPGSGAESYIGLMRANLEAIVDGLR